MGFLMVICARETGHVTCDEHALLADVNINYAVDKWKKEKEKESKKNKSNEQRYIALLVHKQICYLPNKKPPFNASVILYLWYVAKHEGQPNLSGYCVSAVESWNYAPA